MIGPVLMPMRQRPSRLSVYNVNLPLVGQRSDESGQRLIQFRELGQRFLWESSFDSLPRLPPIEDSRGNNERIEERKYFRLGHLNGVLLPAAGGVVAIVGGQGENLEPIEARVTPLLHWHA